MLPVKKQTPTTYRTLEEIRQRKDELLNELQGDNKQFTTLWNSVFVKRENSTKSDYIASLVSNSVTAFDIFLLARKLFKAYGFLKGKKSKRKR